MYRELFHIFFLTYKHNYDNRVFNFLLIICLLSNIITIIELFLKFTYTYFFNADASKKKEILERIAEASRLAIPAEIAPKFESFSKSLDADADGNAAAAEGSKPPLKRGKWGK